MKRFAFGLAALAVSPAFAVTFTFEAAAYTGSTSGTIVTGQDGWYLPSAGGTDHMVYTYAGNTIGVPTNPTGGAQFMSGASANAVVARAQHDVDFSGGGLWVMEYDILVKFEGVLPAVANSSSVSQQDPQAGVQSFIALNNFDDGTTAATWHAHYLAYDNFSTQSEVDPGAGFNGLAVNAWYHQKTIFSFDTHLIIQVSMKDLTSGTTTEFSPTGWYLNGGDSGGGLPLPTAIRAFGGGNDGNRIAVDNLTISAVPEPATWAILATGLALLARRRK